MPNPEKGNRRLSKCRHFLINCGITIRHLKGIIQYLLFWHVLFSWHAVHIGISSFHRGMYVENLHCGMLFLLERTINIFNVGE